MVHGDQTVGAASATVDGQTRSTIPVSYRLDATTIGDTQIEVSIASALRGRVDSFRQTITIVDFTDPDTANAAATALVELQQDRDGIGEDRLVVLENLVAASIRPSGDVNCDGFIDSADANQVLQFGIDAASPGGAVPVIGAEPGRG